MSSNLHTAPLGGGAILRTDWWNSYGLPALSCHRWLLSRRLREEGLAQVSHKPPCWFRYAEDTSVIQPHGLHRNIHFNMEIEKDRHLHFLEADIYGDGMAPWAMWSTENLPTQTSIWTLDQIIIPPKYRPLFQHWCTQPGLCVRRKPPWWVGFPQATFRENGTSGR